MKAEVQLACGRWYLTAGGVILAMEGDVCRDGQMPDSLYDPIPEEELDRASVGGTPARELDPQLLRFFRRSFWNKAMLQDAADRINGG